MNVYEASEANRLLQICQKALAKLMKPGQTVSVNDYDSPISTIEIEERGLFGSIDLTLKKIPLTYMKVTCQRGQGLHIFLPQSECCQCGEERASTTKFDQSAMMKWQIIDDKYTRAT